VAGTDVDDIAGTERWLTYDELAALRGIKRIGAVRLVQRHKWRRQAGNDGLARVLVPHDALEPVRHTGAATSAPTTGRRDRTGDGGTDASISAPDIAAQLAAQLEQANQRADTANKRADASDADRRAAIALADQSVSLLADAVARADRAEQAVVGERTRADTLQGRIEDLNAKLTAVQDQAEAINARAVAAEIAQAKAEADAAELRQAEAERRGRGRWARLRRAWRGAD
jgi:hypothetical protein